MDRGGDAAALRTARRRVRDAWITAVVHAIGSTLILLATDINIVLAAHYPVASAGAVLLLGFGVRRRSRVAAFLLLAAALTPALIKLLLGALHTADLPAFPLAVLYARGFIGTLRYHSRKRISGPPSPGHAAARRPRQAGPWP